MSESPKTLTKPRWKPMDIAYQPVLAAPRVLILETYSRHDGEVRYDTVSERDGVGGSGERSLMASAEEWLEWLTKFQDEMLPPAYRTAQDRVRTPVVEPKSWADFRARYAATGCPWIQ